MYKRQPIIFEIFTNPEDEKKAGFMLVDKNRNATTSEQMKQGIKNTIKNVIGNENSAKLKNMLRK